MSAQPQPPVFRTVPKSHQDAQIALLALQSFAAKRLQQNEAVFRHALRSADAHGR